MTASRNRATAFKRFVLQMRLSVLVNTLDEILGETLGVFKMSTCKFL